MPLKSTRSSAVFHALVIATLAGLGLGVTEYIVTLERRNAREHQRAEELEQLAAIRVAIEQELNGTLSVTRALIAFVATHPELEHDTFHLLADELSVESRHIRNVGLAPANVIRFVHPVEGNEAAIGLSYEEMPEQWPAVQRAIESRSMFLDGPINLVQGGTALIARTPIYAMDPKTNRSERYYWGLSSIVIDHQSLISSALAGCECAAVDFSLRTYEEGSLQDTFYGDPTAFDQDGITLEIAVPGTSWEIGMSAAEFDPSAARFLRERAIGLALTALITLLVSMLISARTLNRRLAMLDALTGVPNRRYAFRRLSALLTRHRRTGQPFGVIVVDVNAFKAINDEHGHGFGDEVLLECGRRLTEGMARSAEVARLGGDEFLVILPSVHGPPDLKRELDRLEQLFSQPLLAPSGVAVTIGVSAGGAMMGGDIKDIKQLLQVADGRMYDRKRRVVEPEAYR